MKKALKNALAVIVTVLFAVSVTSISLAAEEQKAAPAPATGPEKKERPKIKQITGEVKAVDVKTMMITVTKKRKDKVSEVSATVTDKTKIVLEKEKKTLADVKAGDKVTLKYIEEDGKNTAKSIAIKPVEKKAEPAAEKK